MTIQDIQRCLAKMKANMAVLIQKAKDEPQYRRIAIYSLVLLAVILILSPWLGVLLVITGMWYLTL